MRLLEVNGLSLLGATHQEAVDVLRTYGGELHLVVCKGYDKGSLLTNTLSGSKIDQSTERLGSRSSETESELSQSVSSLDRDDVETVPETIEEDQSIDKHVELLEDLTINDRIAPTLTNDVALVNSSEMALVSAKEKSTQEKVNMIIMKYFVRLFC